MSDMVELSPIPLISNRKTIRQRLLPICYFSALLIATAGWLWGIGQTVAAVVNWWLA